MAFLAVAYPHLPPADYNWIQEIRQQYDSHYTLIEPHFTLVFPERTLSQSAFVTHMQAQSANVRPIPFVLRCAIIVKDSFGPATHVFLVPDEGFSAIVKLHDKLYSNALAHANSLDVAYIPHITVADFTDPTQAKALADHINGQERSLHGSIDAVDSISYNNASVVSIARFPLAVD